MEPLRRRDVFRQEAPSFLCPPLPATQQPRPHGLPRRSHKSSIALGDAITCPRSVLCEPCEPSVQRPRPFAAVRLSSRLPHLYLAPSQPYQPSRHLRSNSTRSSTLPCARPPFRLVSPTVMLATSSVPPATPSVQQQHVGESDPFVLYARSLHDYTLRLWTESRRLAEEKARMKAAAAAANGRNQLESSLQVPKQTANEKAKP